MLELRELTTDNLEAIRKLFVSVFTAPPWNDDWSDEQQLTEYLLDLMQVRNPITLGLYEDNELVGLSLGCLKHWCEGTEYYIEELCIRGDMQGRGLGTAFLRLIEEYVPNKGAQEIFLLTERNVPAYSFYKRCGFQELPNNVAFYKEL